MLDHFAGVATVLDPGTGTPSWNGNWHENQGGDSGGDGDETSESKADTGQWEAHPLLELIARGREIAAEHQRTRESVDSLERAVEDYEEAFGMSPPEGFDVW